MQNLSDDARNSTQLEGKKLKGFGARFGKLFKRDIEGNQSLQGSLELDDERGIHGEEIIFDDKGREIEEGKKRDALRHAAKMQKQGEKVSAMKKGKLSKDDREQERDRGVDRSDPKKEIEQIRDTAQVKGEALTEQKRQTDIAQGRDPAMTEVQQIRQSNVVKEQVLQGQQPEPRGNDMAAASFLLGDNVKHLDTSQDAAAKAAMQKQSPLQGMVELAKALLPVQVPDMRDKGQTQDRGGPGM